MILALLNERNRIMGSDGGDFLEWTVHMRNPKPKGVGENTPPEYNTPDNKRVAQLPWSWYHHGKKLSRKTIQTNKGKQAFINVITDAWDEVQNSFSQRWPEYFYQDGDNPPGSEPEPMFGFYTWFNKFIASTSAADQGFQGKVRLCSGTYGNLTMTLGTESSDWTGQDGFETVQATDATLGVTAGQKWWPEGQGESAYDYWHPLIVKCRSTSWGTSPSFNSVYCDRMLDFGITYSARNGKGDKGPINVILSGATPALQMRERYASTYRTMAEIIAQQNPGNPNTNRSGRAYQSEILNFNGVWLIRDYDMPNGQDLIGLNLDTISYHPVHNYDSVTGSTPLIDMVNDKIPGGMGDLIGAYSMGQLRCDTPRNTVIWDGDLV